MDQYSNLKLNELAARSPRQVAAIWRMVSDTLAPVYGEMTVSDLIKRFAAGGRAG
jgi:hypothetical protein